MWLLSVCLSVFALICSYIERRVNTCWLQFFVCYPRNDDHCLFVWLTTSSSVCFWGGYWHWDLLCIIKTTSLLSIFCKNLLEVKYKGKLVNINWMRENKLKQILNLYLFNLSMKMKENKKIIFPKSIYYVRFFSWF